MKDHIIHSEILSTKANTLHALRSMLTLSRIEEMYILKIGIFLLTVKRSAGRLWSSSAAVGS